MLKLTRKNESGRSMIEMLGVLAIIGVLSVGGIAGYTAAMKSHEANETVNQARRLAMIASSKRLLNPSAVLSDSEKEGKYTFTMDPDESQIKLTVTGLTPDVAKRVKDMNLGIAKVGDGEAEGSLVFTFNNDLTERNGDQQGDEAQSESCEGFVAPVWKDDSWGEICCGTIDDSEICCNEAAQQYAGGIGTTYTYANGKCTLNEF